MNAHTRDNALSEVIGMILILAIIVMVMSVYITYTVPEKGKQGEIAHMREVRVSFLELSYLIHSLFANGKTGVSVSIPITLHSSPESAIIPLFTPVSSQGFIAITNESETCTIRFLNFVEQRTSNYPPVTLADEGEIEIHAMKLHENLQSTVFRFEPIIPSNAPIDGIIATLYGKTPSEWKVDLKIRSVLTNVTIESPSPGTDAPLSITPDYLHSLIAVKTPSKLEYVVIDNISASSSEKKIVSVDLKPALDLFGAPLVNGSSLFFSSSGSSITNGTPNLTISYSSYPSSPHTVSTTTPLTDLMFASSNYYWIDQQYRYHKGGVFLRQEEDSIFLAGIPFRIENRSDFLVVSIVDIVLHPKNNRVRSSGGRAQIVVEIQEIQNQVCDEVCDETRCYDTSDAMADSVEFIISSDNQDTIHMWEDIFRGMCATVEGTCKPDVSPGLVTLTVGASSSGESVAVQYTKVDVDLEIRV